MTWCTKNRDPCLRHDCQVYNVRESSERFGKGILNDWESMTPNINGAKECLAQFQETLLRFIMSQGGIEIDLAKEKAILRCQLQEQKDD